MPFALQTEHSAREIQSSCKCDIALATGQFVCHFVGLLWRHFPSLIALTFLFGVAADSEHMQKSQSTRKTLTYDTLHRGSGPQKLKHAPFRTIAYFSYTIYLVQLSPGNLKHFASFGSLLLATLLLYSWLLIKFCCHLLCLFLSLSLSRSLSSPSFSLSNSHSVSLLVIARCAVWWEISLKLFWLLSN